MNVQVSRTACASTADGIVTSTTVITGGGTLAIAR